MKGQAARTRQMLRAFQLISRLLYFKDDIVRHYEGNWVGFRCSEFARRFGMPGSGLQSCIKTLHKHGYVEDYVFGRPWYKVKLAPPRAWLELQTCEIWDANLPWAKSPQNPKNGQKDLESCKEDMDDAN